MCHTMTSILIADTATQQKLQKPGPLQDLRRHWHYEKASSERRRREKRDGIKSVRKRELVLLGVQVCLVAGCQTRRLDMLEFGIEMIP